MDRDSVLAQTAEYARTTLQGDVSGHDWWHVYRVWRSALYIARREQADLFVVQLAALLHDIADWKFHGGDHTVGPRVAGEWLTSLRVEESVVAHVSDIVSHISFRGAGVPSLMTSAEGRVVQDADRLDAIGAVGIARAFAYGGYKGRPLYTPAAAPGLHQSGSGATIDHFYEKLLHLKDLMNTETGKALATERHAFMQQFLARFFAEWDGVATRQ